MLDYDTEAAVYDATRGGEPRARAAAHAVLGLLPDGARTVLDVACGTGLVGAQLSRPGRRVWGADLSPGMLRTAAGRLGGAVVRADGRRLPFADGSLDAVVAIWLLHLLDDAAPVVAEAARVLRPGGVFVTTVDKQAAHDVGSDVDAVLADLPPVAATDAAPLVTRHAGDHGLLPAGGGGFRGHGQGRSPRAAAGDLRRGRYRSATTADPLAEQLATRLEALPDPDRARPDPRYRLLAFRAPTGP